MFCAPNLSNAQFNNSRRVTYLNWRCLVRELRNAPWAQSVANGIP
jgi:hypothetical protein